MQDEKTKEETLNFFTEKGFNTLQNPAITNEQFNLIVEPTPESETEYNDDNGHKYKTVKGSYIKKRLQLIFGWNWDFKIISREYFPSSSEVIVHGRLTIRSGDHKIKKEQFGKHILSAKTTTIKNRTTSAPSNVGNAFKSAATDALKKCASELGICWDIYSQEAPEGKPEEILQTQTYQEEKIDERFKTFLYKNETIKDLEFFLVELQEKPSDSQQALIDKFTKELKSKK